MKEEHAERLDKMLRERIGMYFFGGAGAIAGSIVILALLEILFLCFSSYASSYPRTTSFLSSEAMFSRAVLIALILFIILLAYPFVNSDFKPISYITRDTAFLTIFLRIPEIIESSIITSRRHEDA